ncbi:voltage-dependent calcium channel unc-36 [Plakobranchus ocellatus]|uniref:Voltage-dependent calcium channel unc-36 n=1 Tax=Plakobranchus ocellatus TaxID=259542 RepID=A0AAV4CM11_9GAST|nr:voltage-dependent calcium channel unc-36 [Plakobranchus ocellatus]
MYTCLQDTRKLYLPEDLNGHKMLKVFVQRFNIAFGYPRKDTCSDCDTFNVKLASQETDEHGRIRTEKELHLTKANIFYERKSNARRDAQACPTIAAISFDFWKNLSCPNISTSEVYCRRQLSQYTFNVHSLEDNNAILYAYDETTGKKGADDVTSMLRHYVNNFVPQEVTCLEAFCDSCAGQIKNWTMLRFLHSLVHVEKRFGDVKLSFSIKGHSYMECDREMVCINQKTRVEVPEQWLQLFETSRSNPSLFQVIHMKEFLSITNNLKPLYRATCPIQTRPLRKPYSPFPNHMRCRTIENRGMVDFKVLPSQRGESRHQDQVLFCSFILSNWGYQLQSSRISKSLKRFCTPEAQQYYNNLASLEETEGSPDVSDEDDA